MEPMNSKVDHPNHYGGAESPYEAIKVIDAWGLSFCLGNVVKYIARAGKKDGNSELQDLQKAAWYLNHEIETIKEFEERRLKLMETLARMDAEKELSE